MKLRIPSTERLLRVACILALVALPLMVWSLFDATVWPILIALSVGQGLGTLSFMLFLLAIARDLRLKRKLVAAAEKEEPRSVPPPAEPAQ
jgi:hypothetical protein